MAVVNADDPDRSRCCAAARGGALRLHPAVTVRAPPAGRGRAAVPVEGGFQLGFADVAASRLANRALRGAHNLQNAMAAALLARTPASAATPVQAGLDGFPGLPHRLECVRDARRRGVGERLQGHQRGLGAGGAAALSRAALWLIAGGKGKGAPYAPMVEASAGKVRAVLTIGQDAATIERPSTGRGVRCTPAGRWTRAVARARELARPGDMVLLSPACASYDQFKNFEHRGRHVQARWWRRS